MVKFYALQIQLGKITVDDVPVKYREAVRKYLKVVWYMAETLTEEEYTELLKARGAENI